MVNETPNSQNKIVPKFDSATQILREDQLEMRIHLVVDQDTRRSLEERFRALKGKRPEHDPDLKKAESQYVDRELRPDRTLKLEMLEGSQSYEQEVERLRREFHTTKAADDLKRDAVQKVEHSLQKLERDTDQTLQREKDHGITREEFFKNRNGITSHQFKRAVGRDV